MIPSETNEAGLAAMMVGREVILWVENPPAQPKDEVLLVSNLHVVDQRGLEVVRGVSFTVRQGEILGIAGVQGNGQTELVQALTGVHPDRLKEEQAREMTIELGFGWMILPNGEEIGIVDVPGHRDFH